MATTAMNDVLTRYFDALEPGASFTSRGRTITEADLVGFSGLTGDWHPQHADEVWAASSPFGERIAHGMLLISYAAGLVRFDPERVVALRRLSDVVFKRPVRIGDTIQVEGRVQACRPLDDETGLVTWRWTVRTTRGEAAVRATVEVLWRRSPETQAPAAFDEDDAVGTGLVSTGYTPLPM